VASSFGEALARASQPAEEPAAKPLDKAAAKATARRSGEPGTDKDQPAEPTLVAGLVLIALDSRNALSALGSDARLPADATLSSDARLAVAADPLAKALLNAFLPAKDNAPLPDAMADMTIPADPARVIALVATGVKERGQLLPLTTSRKDTALPAAAADSAPTAVPRMALDAAMTESTALPSAQFAAAETPENKAAPANKAALTAGNDPLPRLETLIAALTTSGFTEPAPSEQTSLEASPTALGSAVMASVAPGPANISNPAAARAAAAPALPQDIGSNEWGKALGKHLLQMGQTGQDTAVLQLNPPGLGPLKVTLSLNEQQIQVAFVSTHAVVRASVEAALPQLRAAMADGGLNLGEASVGSDSRPSADAGRGQEGRPEQRYNAADSAAELAGVSGRAATEPARQASGAGVDTYA